MSCRDSLDSVKKKNQKLRFFFTLTLSPLKSTDIADMLHHDIAEYFTADILPLFHCLLTTLPSYD